MLLNCIYIEIVHNVGGGYTHTTVVIVMLLIN